MSSSDYRGESRLENDDPLHCIDCGLPLQCGDDEMQLFRYDHVIEDWILVERCFACRAEELLTHLSHTYDSDVAVDIQIRGLRVHTEVQR